MAEEKNKQKHEYAISRNIIRKQNKDTYFLTVRLVQIRSNDSTQWRWSYGEMAAS